MKKVFAFDMGEASIGYCVREDFEIKKLGSLIIEKDHAVIDNIRNTRRMHRTKNSHNARVSYFNKIWTECGLSIIDKNDYRFKKEFPSKNENIIYTSCLLRIALLQGQKLEEWQIYKALHNAIQRRGYDSSLPWATQKEKDEGEKSTREYTTENGIELINSDEYKYPCYYEAVRLRLWNEQESLKFEKFVPLNDVIKIRNSAMSTTRELATKELAMLWLKAQEQLSALKKYNVDEFLFGEAKAPYASYNKHEYQKFRGKIKDLEGVLGQKVPRFNNRIIMKCKLFPSKNVCNANNLDSIIFTLLMQLKNVRYINLDGANGTRLTPKEIKTIYENKISEWKEQYKNLKKGKNPTFTITEKDLTTAIGYSQKQFKELNKFEKIVANTSGRSSFCRRACQIMNKIILSGELYPKDVDLSDFIDKPTSPNPITKEEIDNMISRIGDWNNLYIPDNRMEMLSQSSDERQQTDVIIGSITNPIVRNRLQIFRDLLLKLKKEEGTPDEVVFEFVRGKDETNATEKINKEARKNNEEIKEQLGDNFNYKRLEKLKLLKEQNYICFYTGKRLCESDIDNYDIDHIYPRSFVGCDALYNKVLCLPSVNQREKKDRAPYDWFKQDKNDTEWGEYIKRVSHLMEKYPRPKKPSYPSTPAKMEDYYIKLKLHKLARKKYLLLTSPEEKCEEVICGGKLLVDTSYISKIAQKMTAFIFGWGLQVKDENRKIYASNGGLTRKMLNYYKFEKNRNDNRHHAQDAIMISFANMFLNEENKHRSEIVELVNGAMETVVPYYYSHKKQCKKRLNPKENPLGKRLYKDNLYFISKRILLSEITKKDIDKIFDKSIREDLKKKAEQLSDEEFKKLLNSYTHKERHSKVKRLWIKTSIHPIELTYDKNGRERLGELVDFGNKGVKGQFKTSDQSKGQILYYDKKGHVKVMPIFANKSTKEVKETLLDMGCKLYNGGEVFYSGCLIDIPNDFDVITNKYKSGVYLICSLRSDGYIQLKNNVGEILKPFHVKYIETYNFKKLKE